MREIANKIFLLLNEFQTEMYIVLLTVVAMGSGACLLIGGDAREKLKKNWMWIILGAIILGGAITLGADYGAKLKF